MAGGAPLEPCAVIEEVGSTGVGAMALACIIFVVATVIFLSKAWNSVEQKNYYLCASFASGIGAITYFCMLGGDGWSAVDGCRQFFWIRHVGWAITLPLVALLLGLVAQADTGSIAASMGALVLFNFASYMGSYSNVSSVKWLWFLIALVTVGGALVAITRTFKAAVTNRGVLELEQLHGKLATLLSIVLAGIPVVWLFAVGFGGFSVTFEVCAYAILDVLGLALTGFLVMSAHSSLAQNPSNDFI